VYIGSLQESVRLKMSVADDLQMLLKESHGQIEEMRRENKEMRAERDSFIERVMGQS